MTLAFKPKDKVGDNSSQLVCESFSLDGCRDALVEMIIVDELPFKFVEGKGFKKFVDKLTCGNHTRFVVPSRFTVARDVLKLYVNEKNRLRDMFVKNKYRVSLTTDCWTSGQNINYMVLTTYFIDSDWKLHKRILSFSPNENHKGDTIGKTIEKNLKDWGIERVMTLTVDNASSNDTVVAYLLKRFNKGLLFGGKFLHVRCCAHILNLIVTDAFKEHNDCIDRIRYAVRFITSLARFLKFKKCIELKKIACKSYVCLDVPTRWNSTCMMLEAAVKFEKAFDRLEDEDASYRHDMSPNREDWTNARMLIQFLKVFYDVTLKISGSLYTTSNLVFHQITVVQNCIRLNAGSANALLVGMANNMKPKFEKYWGNNEKNNLLLRLFHEYSTTRSGSRQGCSSTSTTSTQTVSGLDTNIDFDSNENVGEDFVYDTIVGEFEDDSTTPFEQGSSKIDIYLLEANVRTKGDFDILQWWKMNSDRFEVLGHMARDILAIPVYTVASESAFSTGGRVVDSSRCSLAPNTVEALICTQNWLNSDPIHLQFQHELEEASKFEEGFWVVMENEKELEDLPDFDKLSTTDY
ncbi:zinc finger BED domain-containing protein RICESLEEPER 3-like [Cucumis melo var. makuwa]|uniref:Zinc finger BED domain-containing protein RICESLEEPER 3-like n=1 Tax=Cucumis melo var. makuwa TaxID=1194695 RepID=A0A5D3BVD4_CUCMM|nr:zinc finger BED domain-containing protein RICESLEEPER 3-like [Cucumis melo var. makuwa]TYK03663.1 zinc finger BED domain-containing protein RICESLEEPER 3-like [Cucumis melo var. makuwa]